MLENLKDLFKKEFQLSHVAALLNQVHQLVSVFRADFMKDKDSKNAAIDTLCQLLQEQKDPVVVPTVPPVVPPAEVKNA
jgi:hypothetical protein